jgi:hypothetical protein
VRSTGFRRVRVKTSSASKTFILNHERILRKQVYDLSAADLCEYPAWEFAIDEEGEDGQDEASVRPLPLHDIDDHLDGSAIVAAEFTLADGTILPGYLTPRTRPNMTLGDIQPQIITDRGQVMFWYGRCPMKLENLYNLLQRSSSEVFPIRFKAMLPIENHEYIGEIPGFLALGDDFETVTIVK